jgi:endonuclease G
MLISPSMWEQAAARWRRRTAEREEQVGSAHTESRPRLRVERLTKTAAVEKARAAVLAAEVSAGDRPRATEEFTLERVIGKRDLLDENFLELAIAMARTVARVRLSNGFGTGFLVSPSLLITNHHVIETIDQARGATAEFDYQRNGTGDLLPVQSFAFDPDRFLILNSDLDYALVAVRPLSNNGAGLERYGWVKLIPEQGKADAGDCVNIIQHPNGELKQIALRENEVVDIFEDYLHYRTDTEPGSSGSPCFNDQWELVSLHHSGVPKTDSDGKLLRDDGQPWRNGVDAAGRLVWIANEGIRVSSIVKSLKAAQLDSDRSKLIEQMLGATPPNPIELARTTHKKDEGQKVSVPVSTPGTPGQVTFTIPLQVTFSVGGAVQNVQPVMAAPAAEPSTAERVVIDPDYSNRSGYNPSFLPGFPVPFPAISQPLRRDAVVNTQARGTTPYLLDYEHFSLVMNSRRRIAIVTGVNIDGTKPQSLESRSGDVWSLDPRIGGQFQIDGTAYVHNAIDRGHLVRRLDPVWGSNTAVALRANNDTFHFTNCSPQHKAFNQGGELWQGLENYLLQKASEEHRKLVVFTGPVLRRSDPVYRNEGMNYDIRIPMEFWKVAALIKPGGEKVSAAFIVSQKDLIGDATDLNERLDVRTFQVPVSKVEALTGLRFGTLRTCDSASRSSALERLDTAGAPARVLKSADDIQL